MQKKPKPSRKKILTGVVVSDKMNKTIVVKVTTLTKHPKYQKVIKRHASFKAHDETNQAKIGDIVKIMECRPLSRDKRWRLIQIGKK